VRNVQQITRQVHRRRALSIIQGHPELRWLASKPEILDTLGRIETDYALLVMAKRLCELKPPTAEAVEMIQRNREFNALADEIVHVIKDYRKRHPDTTRAEILRALEAANTMLTPVGEEGAQPGKHQFLQRVRQGDAVTP